MQLFSPFVSKPTLVLLLEVVMVAHVAIALILTAPGLCHEVWHREQETEKCMNNSETKLSFIFIATQVSGFRCAC
jgi:hypothetical protein